MRRSEGLRRSLEPLCSENGPDLIGDFADATCRGNKSPISSLFDDTQDFGYLGRKGYPRLIDRFNPTVPLLGQFAEALAEFGDVMVDG